jgi:Protein of unknown function (DUF2971)
MDDRSVSKVPPDILYHYTSQSGLIGMLNTKKIWASSIHYLNDSKEFALALKLARDELTIRARNATSKLYSNRFELLHDSIYSIEQVHTCVCCFSASGDSLSQWRGYGGGKAGFSVGFSREWFAEVTKTPGLTLSPCIYEPAEQQTLIQETLDDFLADNAKAKPDFWDANRSFNNPDKPRTITVLKHAGDYFADEEEWRLVARNVSVFDLKHRPGESMRIPYYSISIGDESKFDSISKIIVGPTPHPVLSVASVTSLAIAAGLVTGTKRFEAETTKIPFRSW